MRKQFLLFFIPTLLFAQVELGIDRFFKDGFVKEIENKKIGIVTNQTGVNSSLKSSLELFFENASSYKIKALFAPEHGLTGKIYAGEVVEQEMYKKVPVYSLHGKTRRPTKEMLQGLDVIIYDIQDIGSRTYTFATTLFYLMEEAAKYGISVIVLDRPNPMGGIIVDGPMLLDNFRSFIGYINVPYCHGMTIGELASYFNKEYKVGAKLTVVPMKGWERKMSFQETGLHWIPTSPNIPEGDTPFFYATTGILGELSLVNIGIGYTLPFKIVGAPWIQGETFAKALNDQKLPGVIFTPIHYRPFYGSFKNTECHGVKITITDKTIYKPLMTQYYLIGLLKSLYPQIVGPKLLETPKNNKELFHKANGTDTIFQMLVEGKYPALTLVEEHKAKREAFLETRKKYLLYPY